MTVGVTDVQEYVRGLLDSCKGISAKDAADRAGIPLTQKGSRYWANCFVHQGDRTASMVFYDDGRFYCHACHASGDAVRVYEHLYNLKSVNAARRLREDFGLSPYDAGIKSVTIDPVYAEQRRLRDAYGIREKRRDELITDCMQIELDLSKAKKDIADAAGGEETDAEMESLRSIVDELNKVRRSFLDLVDRLDGLTDEELLAWVERGAHLNAI